MRLYLIRHGETEYNRTHKMQGHQPIPLNDLGIQQAKLLAARMQGLRIDKIYASDLRRTVMTASILSAYTGVPVFYDRCFRERDPGRLIELSYEDAMPFFNEQDYVPPGGESVRVFEERVRQACRALVRREGHLKPHLALVSHGMFVGAFLRACAGLDPEELALIPSRNTALTIAEYTGRWRVPVISDTSHLENPGDPHPFMAGG